MGAGKWFYHTRPRTILNGGKQMKHSLVKRIFKARYIYLAMFPSIAFICIFNVYPILQALYMAFTDWKMNNFYNVNFVGFDNFAKVLSDPLFWKSCGNLLIFIVWGFINTMLWLMPITYLVYKLGTGKLGRFVQRAYIIPMMVPGMVITLFWRFFYETNFGMLNTILRMLGADGLTHVWLGEEMTALPALLFMGFPWIGGFGFLVLLAGFQGIDISLHEAAVIDGANAFRIFRKIDIPLIIPQMKILIMLGMINGIQQYTNQMIMTQGGPNYATYVPGLMMYKTAFTYGKLGYGAAIGVILFIIIMIFTVIFNTKIKSVD